MSAFNLVRNEKPPPSHKSDAEEVCHPQRESEPRICAEEIRGNVCFAQMNRFAVQNEWIRFDKK